MEVEYKAKVTNRGGNTKFPTSLLPLHSPPVRKSRHVLLFRLFVRIFARIKRIILLNKKIIQGVLGQLLFLEAILLLCCWGVGFVYREERLFLIYGLPILTAVLAGSVLWRRGRGAEQAMSRRDGFITVTITWLLFSLIGSLPFMLSGIAPRFSVAFFEAMSGFSTTGASALHGLDNLPHSVLFWRSLMHWVGGVGIVFFTLAILPNMNAGEQNMFSVETTGLKIGKLHPRIRTTAHWIGSLYLLLTAVCAVALYLGGAGIFDAVNHAMSTLATGGFSTHDASIGWFHTHVGPQIEYILTAFMFVSGISFTLLYLLVIKRKFKYVWQDQELRCYVGLVVGITLFVGAVLIFRDHREPLEALSTAAFHVVSIQTTTGFTTEDFMQWSTATWMPIVFLALTGACAGSTSGGIKCVRVLTIWKVVQREFRRILHPRAVFSTRVNRTHLSDDVVRNIFVFVTCYAVLVILGTALMMAMGCTMMDAVSCSVTSLSNVGPGYGYQVGPLSTWDVLPDGALYVCSFLMLVGRLEIYAVLVLFTKDFWQRY